LLEQQLVYGKSYFLGYVRYGGLLEEDIRGKEETSRGVEQGWMMWGRGGEDDQPNLWL